MNYLSFIAPLMVMTHLWESPIVVIGYDPCTEAMISRKDMGRESIDEFESCLDRNNYFREAVVPQKAVIPSIGCGTGCAVETRQLAPPELLDDGWVRVQVEWTKRHYDHKGKEFTWRGVKSGTKKRGWNFAQCSTEKFGVGSNDDRNNADIQSPFYEDGSPKYATAARGIYQQWKALCSATAEMR